MEKLKVGIIGLGCRGYVITDGILAAMCKDDLEIKVVCDQFADRVKRTADTLERKTGYRPDEETDYKAVIARDDITAVIIMTSWRTHLPMAIEAMAAGKYVGIEVGGAYTLKECWDLIEAGKKYGNRLMFLENCCYGDRELMITRMVREGVMGEVIHCSGGYMHDLREEIINGKENRHYRLGNYLNRNCENYPTHELGPIAKLLDINNGNRFCTLTSTASKAGGLHEYALQNRPADDPLTTATFAQGDIITTVIKCARGETITITLDTTLPRYYSRGFTVRGTKAGYFGENDSLFIDGEHNSYEFKGSELWGNAKNYIDQYRHPIWQNYDPVGGHDGMDWLVYRAFVEAAKAEKRAPIDLYDAVTYMCITALSEQSIQRGGAPVDIPDFTEGRWFMRDDIDYDDPYCLEVKQPLRDGLV